METLISNNLFWFSPIAKLTNYTFTTDDSNLLEKDSIGKVYKATRVEDGKLFAIKVIKLSVSLSYQAFVT